MTRQQSQPLHSVQVTPWDTRALGINTFEISELNNETLNFINGNPGHYTFRVDPLSSKVQLNDNKFYYVDTLITPYCNVEKLKAFKHADTSVTTQVDLNQLIEMCSNSFSHDRFHRDPNISNENADQRYKNWLRDLSNKKDACIYALLYQNTVAGFIACEKHRLVLHTIKKEFRGLGLAKYFWSDVCVLLFEQGYTQIESSVSVSNIPVMNLYISLGFKFMKPVDIYHKMVE